MATVEELTGLIAGLASVVKGLTTNVAKISDQVGQLTTADPTAQTPTNLKLPALQLPKFQRDKVVQDDVFDFLERFEEQTSGLPYNVRLALLEQQCVGEWSRSVLSVCRSSEGYSDKDLSEQYKFCVQRLKEEFGEPKEDKCRRLACELSTMKQQSNETIEQFSFRFKNVLHQLDKLGESMMKHCPTYSIAQFVSRVKPEIAQHLIIKVEEFKQLDKAIDAARRVEQSLATQHHIDTSALNQNNSSLEDCKPPGAFATTPRVGQHDDPSDRKPKRVCYRCGDSSHLQRRCPLNDQERSTNRKPTEPPEICRNFNRFLTSRCEQSGNKCTAGRVHQCLECKQWGCKAIRHKQNDFPHILSNVATSQQTGAVPTQKPLQSLPLIPPQLPVEPPAQIPMQIPPLISTPTPFRTTPEAMSSQSSPATLFGLPAITSPQGIIQNRHILWTPINSAGENLPLPIDSCCSVSLVSQRHANLIASRRPSMEYQNLQQPIPVSVADAKSKLHAIGTMQVPIKWLCGNETIFTMLVVPHLSWPILFGENHLHSTQALVDHAKPTIQFRHPSMQFTVSGSLDNPLKDFNQATVCPHAGVICLLTGNSFLDLPSKPTKLHQGLNFLTVNFTLGTTLAVSSPDQWLEGRTIQPGVTILSGPFHYQERRESSFPTTTACYASLSNVHIEKEDNCLPTRSLDPSEFHADDIPNIDKWYSTTLAVDSKLKSTTINQNVILAEIRPSSLADKQLYEDAASTTAEQLANGWLTWAQIHDTKPSNTSKPHPAKKPTPMSISMSNQTWKQSEQNAELQSAGLDSSILSSFTEQDSESHQHEQHYPFPEYEEEQSSSPQVLFDALGLDTDKYAHVKEEILKSFKNILTKYTSAFLLPGEQLSEIKGFEHNIDTGDALPVYKHPYRKSPEELLAIKNEIERMLKLKIVQPSKSEWGAPCILVQKPLENGKKQPPRFVVDYRGLNSVTCGDGYPIPSISSVLDSVTQGTVFAHCDLASGYWQIPLKPKDQPKTAFCTHVGLYEFLRLPFGLKTAPSTFQRILNTVFADYLYQWLAVYVDDILTWSKSHDEALHHYELLLERAARVNIQFKPSKCVFFAKEMDVLGHHITQHGRQPTSKGIEAITTMPHPRNVKTLRRFLGLCSYFRDYIPDMPTKTRPLRELLKKNTPFTWSDVHHEAYEELKHVITGPNVMLYHPDWNSPFEIHTDASKVGCGAMLAQMKDNKLRPIRFASRAFNETESRWTTTQQELYAVKWGLEQFRPYILGRRTKVITDHANLQWLTSIAPQQSKLARWCLSMAEFDFYVEHRSGVKNIVPDVLSRQPMTDSLPSETLIIPPDNDVLSFLLMTTSADIPHHTQNVHI